MKIKEMQLYVALNDYVEKELMPIGATMDLKEQFNYGVRVGLLKFATERKIKKFLKSDEIKQLELMDEDGNIEIEPLYEVVSGMFQKIQKYEIGGFIFKENDLKSLYDIAKIYATRGDEV
jgi:hypothetical protein